MVFEKFPSNVRRRYDSTPTSSSARYLFPESNARSGPQSPCPRFDHGRPKDVSLPFQKGAIRVLSLVPERERGEGKRILEKMIQGWMPGCRRRVNLMWRNDGRFLDAAMCRCVRRESIYYVIVRETVRDTGGDLISSFFSKLSFRITR